LRRQLYRYIMKMNMKIEQKKIRLVPMTADMYSSFFIEYENDPDLCLPGQAYVHYEYSEEKVSKYVQRLRDLNRIPLAVLYEDEIVGEIIIKNIAEHQSATLGLAMKNARYKDRGFGTKAEQLVIQYVFNELDIPVLYADTILSNTRSQHVLEKVGFQFIKEEGDFRYYQIER